MAPSQSDTTTLDRRRVLLIVHPDGRSELYGEQLDVQVIHVPDVGETSVRADLACEAYIESTLSFRHRGIFWPLYRAAIGDTSRCTPPSRRQQAQSDLEVIRWANDALQAFREYNSTVDASEVA